MGMIQEFRDFAIKGNVVDMAIGIIIGGAFGAITTSLVADIMTPAIGVVAGKTDMSWMNYSVVSPIDGKEIAIKFGDFLNKVANFLIVAFCMFLVVKQMNRLKRNPPPPEPTTKDCPFCCSNIPLKATRCGHCTSQLA